MDTLNLRQRILLNQPHIESVKDNSVSFTTDMKAPLKECKVYFEPIQEGSGDPSPDNVRNITGWDGVEVKNSNNVYSIDWTDDVGTVYGGYVDLVKGELVAEYESISDTWGNWGTLYDQGDGTELRYKKFINSIIGGSAGSNNSYCNIAKYKYNNTDGTIHFYNAPTSNNCRIYLPSGTDTSLQIQAVARLAEPIHYQLTPQQILSLKGINNFSCGIKNDLSIRYWNHKKSDSSNIAYEAKNLTFDGTNYIDTGVYLFSEKNINRNFEVVIEDLYGGDPSNKTIVCAKYDSTAIGFLIRLNSAVGAIYNGTISMKTNNHNNITIKRINGVITIEGEIITNPKVKFTNAVHNHPLVLGCALQDDGTPFRYEAGTIGHITVKWL